MNNVAVVDEETLQTPFGIIGAVRSYENYSSGELKSVILKGENVILTHAGDLTPYYTETPRRKFKPSVQFFKDGMIKAVYLEEQQELNTPIGEILGELVTFYNTGELHRVFPLDGKLSGFWGEEEEKELLIPMNFDLDFCEFTACLSCICFYESGNIKSLTLFPEEEIKVGAVTVRHGVSLYESGALESCEPAIPTLFDTPIGKIMAYDPDAVGVTADSNSVTFHEDGSIKSLMTVSQQVQAQDESGKIVEYAPQIIPAFFQGAEETIAALEIHFHKTGVSFGKEKKMYPYSNCGFTVLDFQKISSSFACKASDCSSCSLCSG